MNITDIKIFKLDRNTLKGFASVTFENCFKVTGIKIMQGSKGLFVNMPSQKSGEKWQDICYPTTKEFREQLQKAILDKYNAEENGFYPAEEGEEDGLPF